MGQHTRWYILEIFIMAAIHYDVVGCNGILPRGITPPLVEKVATFETSFMDNNEILIDGAALEWETI